MGLQTLRFVPTLRLIVATTALAAGWGVETAPAHGPSIRLGSSVAAPGDSLAITGEGMGVDATIALALECAAGRIVLARVPGDADGRFATTVVLPGDAPTGACRLVATAGEDRASADLAVTREADRTLGSGLAPATADDLHLTRRRSRLETILAWAAVGGLLLAGTGLFRGRF